MCDGTCRPAAIPRTCVVGRSPLLHDKRLCLHACARCLAAFRLELSRATRGRDLFFPAQCLAHLPCRLRIKRSRGGTEEWVVGRRPKGYLARTEGEVKHTRAFWRYAHNCRSLAI